MSIGSAGDPSEGVFMQFATDTKSRHWKTTAFVTVITFLAGTIGWLLIKPPAKVVEGESFILGTETCVYGFPLVVMGLTRQVMTAAPAAGGFRAPIDQFQKLRGRACLQAKSPGKDKESNWLPIPRSGLVNVTLRVYDPKDEAKSAGTRFRRCGKSIESKN